MSTRACKTLAASRAHTIGSRRKKKNRVLPRSLDGLLKIKLPLGCSSRHVLKVSSVPNMLPAEKVDSSWVSFSGARSNNMVLRDSVIEEKFWKKAETMALNLSVVEFGLSRYPV
jgi:hypothetical protein